MSLLDNLPHLCLIRRKTTTLDEHGGSKTTPVEVKTDVACWEQNAGHREVIQYEKVGMIVNRKVYFDADPGVDESYEILITSRDAGQTTIPIVDRKVLEVRSEALPDATAGLGVAFKVMAEETPGARQ